MNESSQLSHSDYAINAGDYDPGSGTGEAGPGPSENTNASINSYTWWDMSKVTGVSFQRSEITMAQIHDGTSNTYLVGEKYMDADYYLTGEDYGDNEGMFDGFANNNTRFCNLTPMQDQSGNMNYCCFGSAHAGGFNMAFCDGSVATISYSIDSVIHARLGNRNDGQSVSAEAF